MKIRPVVAELFLAEIRTEGGMDRHYEANSHFTQFCERAQESFSITLPPSILHVLPNFSTCVW